MRQASVRLALCGLGLGLWIMVSPAPLAQDAGDSANDPKVREVAAQLACYCGCSTQSIADCTGGVANKSRNEIQASLQGGATTQDVVDAWVERFGSRILLEPPREGFHLLGWFLPSILLLLAGLGLLLMMRKWQRRNSELPAAAAEQAPPDPRYLEQLERDLDRMKP